MRDLITLSPLRHVRFDGEKYVVVTYARCSHLRAPIATNGVGGDQLIFVFDGFLR